MWNGFPNDELCSLKISHFWSLSLHSMLGSAGCMGSCAQHGGPLAGLSLAKPWDLPCLPLPPQVAVLTITERVVLPTPAAPRDPFPLWGSPAAQGSPGDGGLRGEWVSGGTCSRLRMNQGSDSSPHPATDSQLDPLLDLGLPSSPVGLRGWGPAAPPPLPHTVELGAGTLDDTDPCLLPLPQGYPEPERT